MTFRKEPTPDGSRGEKVRSHKRNYRHTPACVFGITSRELPGEKRCTKNWREGNHTGNGQCTKDRRVASPNIANRGRSSREYKKEEGNQKGGRETILLIVSIAHLAGGEN